MYNLPIEMHPKGLIMNAIAAAYLTAIAAYCVICDA